MIILEENRITVTKALFVEGMLRISRDGYGKSAVRACLIFLGIWGVMLVYTLSSGGSFSQSLGLLGLVAAICLWLCVIMPRGNAKRAWKRQAARFGSNAERTTCFYEDRLTVTGDGVEKTVPYRQIREIKYSRHLMILVTDENEGILLSLAGFRTGTPDRAESLILRGSI